MKTLDELIEEATVRFKSLYRNEETLYPAANDFFKAVFDLDIRHRDGQDIEYYFCYYPCGAAVKNGKYTFNYDFDEPEDCFILATAYGHQEILVIENAPLNNMSEHFERLKQKIKEIEK